MSWMLRRKSLEARLCAFCIDFCELRARACVAQTQRKENQTTRKASSALYNHHYVKLTLSYPQNLEYSGITV